MDINLSEENSNFETYCLIWLDASVNETQENREAQIKLRSLINHLDIFQDDQLCLNYIESLPRGDRSVLIVSGQFGQTIVPKINQLRSINLIYIFCFDINFHKQWAQNYSKVKGVFNDLKELIKQLNFDHKEKEHAKIDEDLVINILNSKTNEGITTRDLNNEFLQTQLLIECLIRIKSNNRDENELIQLCKRNYKNSQSDLNMLNKFRDCYSSSNAIWWYTEESFLYRILNKALRTQNIHLLYLFRFVICDIQKQLKDNQCSQSVQVFRAQMMSIEEINSLENSLGEIISINTFLSTSIYSHCARNFFNLGDITDNTEKVLFEIHADPRIDNINVFCDVTSLSAHPHEHEVIFMIGSIFRLEKVFKDNDGIWNICMSLCSFNDERLFPLYKQMKKQLGDGETTLLKLAQILRDMRKFDDAIQCLNRVLKIPVKEKPDIGGCYFEFGRIEDDRGDYQLGLEWYKKALNIKQQTLAENDLSIASTYGNIANIYGILKDYKNALESYEKAMNIYEQNSGKEQLYIASCLNNMGAIYQKEKNYIQALECYQKSFDIRQECCHDNHHHLGTSYNNLGIIYSILNNNDQALKHLHKSLEIFKICFSTKHPKTISILENIGIIYENQGDFEQALVYYQKAEQLYRKIYHSTDPNILRLEKRIQNVSIDLFDELT